MLMMQPMPSNLERLMFLRVTRSISSIRAFSPDMFDDERLRLCYKTYYEYVNRYKKLPNFKMLAGLINIWRTKGTLGIDLENSEEMSDMFVEALYDDSFMRVAYEEENEWLDSQIDERIKSKCIEKAVLNATSAMRAGEYAHKDPVAIVSDIKEKLNDAIVPVMTKLNTGLNFYNPEHHTQLTLERTTTGLTFLDKCSGGGYWKGSLWCMMGAPKSGKTYTLHNLVAAAVNAGVDCCLVSLELQREMCMSRIGSNLLTIPVKEYDQAFESGIVKHKLLGFQASNFSNGDLDIESFPTSKMTVSDLATFLLSNEQAKSKAGKPFKYKVVFVDYINIMADEQGNKNDNSYTKIKHIAEGLRRIAEENGWCIVTATQTNRAQTDSEDIVSSDVSESNALNATLDMMFGIIKTPNMDANNEMYLKCLLSRAGGMNTKQRFILEKEYLRMTEDRSPGGYYDPSGEDSARSFYNNPQADKPLSYTTDARPITPSPVHDLRSETTGTYYGHKTLEDFHRRLDEVAPNPYAKYNDPEVMRQFGVLPPEKKERKPAKGVSEILASPPVFIESDDDDDDDVVVEKPKKMAIQVIPEKDPFPPKHEGVKMATVEEILRYEAEQKKNQENEVRPMGMSMGYASPYAEKAQTVSEAIQSFGYNASDDPLNPMYSGMPSDNIDEIIPTGMGKVDVPQPVQEVAPQPTPSVEPSVVQEAEVGPEPTPVVESVIVQEVDVVPQPMPSVEPVMVQEVELVPPSVQEEEVVTPTTEVEPQRTVQQNPFIPPSLSEIIQEAMAETPPEQVEASKAPQPQTPAENVDEIELPEFLKANMAPQPPTPEQPAEPPAPSQEDTEPQLSEEEVKRFEAERKLEEYYASLPEDKREEARRYNNMDKREQYEAYMSKVSMVQQGLGLKLNAPLPRLQDFKATHNQFLEDELVEDG